MIEWWWLLVAVGFGWAIGYWRGGCTADWYWADHGEHGGAVHHKGKFYIVGREDKQRLVFKEQKYEQEASRSPPHIISSVDL